MLRVQENSDPFCLSVSFERVAVFGNTSAVLQSPTSSLVFPGYSGFCECPDSLMGPQCQVDSATPPNLLLAGEMGICDLETSSLEGCRRINLMGNGFLPGMKAYITKLDVRFCCTLLVKGKAAQKEAK